MKRTLNNKKLNININVLPDKYRWHFIKFRYVVAVLLMMVAVAGVILVYQVVIDALAHTKELNAQSDRLNESLAEMVSTNKERASMQQTINEYSKMRAKNGVLLNDVTSLYLIEADSGVEMESVTYKDRLIEVTVPAFNDTAGYTWDDWVVELEAFADALRAHERFRTVTYEDPDFASGAFTTVVYTITVAG